MLPFASDKAKLFTENLSRNSNLDDSGIFLPVLPSRTNLKLHSIFLASMGKNVRANLGWSKASGPDFIPLVVLKKCEPEFSYMLVELLNKCLKESCFPDCSKVLLVDSVFRNVGGKVYKLKTTALLVLFLWLVKSLKCGLFSDGQYGFRSFQPTSDLLSVVFN